MVFLGFCFIQLKLFNPLISFVYSNLAIKTLVECLVTDKAMGVGNNVCLWLTAEQLEHLLGIHFTNIVSI